MYGRSLALLKATGKAIAPSGAWVAACAFHPDDAALRDEGASRLLAAATRLGTGGDL